MISDIVTWGTAVAALGLMIALGRVWMDLGVSKQKADDAAKSTHEAHQRIDKLLEKSATVDDIAAAERRFADAVSGMRSDFQHMAGRLDTLLAGLISRPAQ